MKKRPLDEVRREIWAMLAPVLRRVDEWPEDGWTWEDVRQMEAAADALRSVALTMFWRRVEGQDAAEDAAEEARWKRYEEGSARLNYERKELALLRRVLETQTPPPSKLEIERRLVQRDRELMASRPVGLLEGKPALTESVLETGTFTPAATEADDQDSKQVECT